MVKDVDIRIYPDVTFGYIVEVYSDKVKNALPIATMGTLEKALEMLESKSFENFVEVFLGEE